MKWKNTRSSGKSLGVAPLCSTVAKHIYCERETLHCGYCVCRQAAITPPAKDRLYIALFITWLFFPYQDRAVDLLVFPVLQSPAIGFFEAIGFELSLRETSFPGRA